MKKNIRFFDIVGICVLIGAFLFTACPNDGGTTPSSPAVYNIVVGTFFGGTVEAEPVQATEGTWVDLLVTITTPGWVLVTNSLKVLDEDGDPTDVVVEDDGADPNTGAGYWQFQMPGYDVQIVAQFVDPVNPFTTAPFLSVLTPGDGTLGYTITASDPVADGYNLWHIQGNTTDVTAIKGGTQLTNVALSGTIPGLNNGTAYSVVVMAYKTGYNQVNSNSNTQTGTPVAPTVTAPTLSALTAGVNTLAATWTVSAPAATSYTVYWGMGTQSADNLVAGANSFNAGTALTYTIPSLTNDQLYSVVVRATVVIGSNTYYVNSAVQTGTPQAAPPPVFSAAPTLTAGTAGDTTFIVNWSNSTPAATSYTVYWGAGTQSADNLVAGSNSFNAGTALTYTIPSLTNGQLYSVVVRATDGTRTPINSNVVTGTPNIITGPTYSITINPSTPPTGGSVSASATSGITAGTPITLTVAPASGRELGSLTGTWDSNGNNLSLQETDTNTWRFNMPPSSVTINATFIEAGVIPIFLNGIMYGDFIHWEGDEATWVNDEMGPTGQGIITPITLAPSSGYFHGFAIDYPDGIDLNSVDALSLWIRARGRNVTVDRIGFGGAAATDPYGVDYAGENNQGFVATTTWQQLIIPLPKRIDGTIYSAFQIGITGSNINGAELYLHDIRFIPATVSMTNLIIPDMNGPIEMSPTQTRLNVVLGGSRATYSVNGTTRSLYINRVKFDNWYNTTYTVTNATLSAQAYATGMLTPNAGVSNFPLTVQFDTRVSNEMTVQVFTTPIVWIENFLDRTPGPTGGFHESIKDGQTLEAWVHMGTPWGVFSDTIEGATSLPVLECTWHGIINDWAGMGQTYDNPIQVDGRVFSTFAIRVMSNRTGAPPLLELNTNVGRIDINIGPTVANTWQIITFPIPNGLRQINEFTMHFAWPDLGAGWMFYMDYFRAE
ncbi:MAG: hypothetical protein FWD36_00490 [Treponema sp.]|nr:hypothetical protein [Treponema sp.]